VSVIVGTHAGRRKLARGKRGGGGATKNGEGSWEEVPHAITFSSASVNGEKAGGGQFEKEKKKGKRRKRKTEVGKVKKRDNGNASSLAKDLG